MSATVLEIPSLPTPPEVTARAAALFTEQFQDNAVRTDQLFAKLLVAEWVVMVLLAVYVSPLAWEGRDSRIHTHVWAALVLGGLNASLPCFMVWKFPGLPITRHVVSAAQMFVSALLIHLTGGRIESHFHVFGSLALLAFYRDWRVFLTATVLVGLDHLLRGIYWPQSVYGVIAATPWRTLEHAWWVVFENAFLVNSCFRSLREMHALARRQADLEYHTRNVEREVAEKTASLQASAEELRRAVQAEQVRAAELEVTISQLAQAQEAAEEAARAKGSFLAHMSSELRNPLNTIIHSSDLLLEAEEHGDVGDPTADLKRIQSAGQHVLAIVNNLLNLSRMESGRLPVAMEKFDPAEVLQGIVETSRSLAAKNGNELILDCQIKGVVIRSDSNRLRQVLLNLVDNACKFTENGTVTLGAKLVRRNGANLVQFDVRDTGYGMTSDQCARLFQPFGSSPDDEHRAGAGLGLAICKRICDALGASISVQSISGVGSSFSVYWPIEPPMAGNNHTGTEAVFVA